MHYSSLNQGQHRSEKWNPPRQRAFTPPKKRDTRTRFGPLVYYFASAVLCCFLLIPFITTLRYTRVLTIIPVNLLFGFLFFATFTTYAFTAISRPGRVPAMEWLGHTVLLSTMLSSAIWLPDLLTYVSLTELRPVLGPVFLFSPTVWLAGCLIRRSMEQHRMLNVLIRALFATWLLLGLSTIILAAKASKDHALASARFLVGDKENPLHAYLGMCDSLAICSLLLLPTLLQRCLLQHSLFLCTVVLLTYGGSRASLIAFVPIGVFCLILSNTGKNFVKVSVGFVCISVLAFGFLAFRESDTLRVYSTLVLDPSNDGSAITRRQIMRRSVGNILERPLLGRFWDEWWMYGEGGNYLHNILSYATTFGIPVFTGLMLLIVLCSLNLVRRTQQIKDFVSWQITPTFIYCVLLAIFVRSYTWSHLWFALSIAAGHFSSRITRTGFKTHFPRNLSVMRAQAT